MQPSTDPATRLVITGVMDIGALTTGFGTPTPRAIQVYALEDIPDLAEYGLDSANNGAASAVPPPYTFPSGPLNAGEFFTVSIETTNYNAYFGSDPDDTDNVASINGDDAIVLYYNGSVHGGGSSWTVVDRYGVVGEQPSVGNSWNYKNKWAARKDGQGPNPTFNIGEWDISNEIGTTCTTNAACTGRVFPYSP